MPDLSALTRLEILYLHDNALTELPALPPSLTYLNVSENPLRAIALGDAAGADRAAAARPRPHASSELPPLPALRELHLRTNALTAVPGERCAALHELRLLDLRANRLTSVPDWLVELPRLEKLDLRWNEVYDPPARAAGARLRRAHRVKIR